MDSKICKIVYFDDEAITDYVQIAAGRELQSTTELLNSREGKEKQSASAGAKGGIGGIFKALLGWEASANVDVSAELGFSSNKMVKNIVKNTILTDFLKLIESEETKKSRFDNIRILKTKIENAIFDKLTQHFIINTNKER